MRCPNCLYEIKNISSETNYCQQCGYNLKKAKFDKDESLKCARLFASKGYYSDAVLSYRTSCQLGNSDAMYEYGQLYIKGLGVVKSDKHVIYCMQKAAELGNINAILFLIDAYNNSLFGLPRDINVIKKLVNRLPNTHKTEYTDIFDEMDADETSTVGSFFRENGSLNEIEFEIEIPSDVIRQKEIFQEEKKSLSNYYNKVDSILNDYKNNISKEEMIYHQNFDEYISEITKRNNNKRYNEYIKNINDSLSKPYIGRITLEFPNNDIRDIYVGKKMITDKNNNILIHSWDSEIGKKIYDETRTSWVINGNNVQLKLNRKIIIENKILYEVFELYNRDNKNIKFNQIIADEYLKEIIKRRHAEGKVTDIIESIQYNQSKIITAEFNKNLIMQGCAGSGKTMVLFHRLRYLLTQKNITSKNVLILTPSKKFNDFINPLLLDLEINNIDIQHMSYFYLSVLDDYLNARAKYRWRDLFKENNVFGLEKYTLASDNNLPIEVVNYFYSNEFFDKVKVLKTIKIEPLSKLAVKNKNNKSIDIFEKLLTPSIINELGIPKYKKSNRLHKCELYALALLYFVRCGNYIYKKDNPGFDGSNPCNFNFDFIMIDEAQDLSVNEIKFISSLGKSKPVINLFGDVSQNVNEYGIDNWEKLNNIVGEFDLYNFGINYRNSSEITTYVNERLNMQMDSVGYDSYNVMECSLSNLMSCFESDNISDKIIICSKQQKKELKKIVAKETWKFIYFVQEIKGMEFGSVYVFDKGMTHNELYISCTRALEKLTIIKD